MGAVVTLGTPRQLLRLVVVLRVWCTFLIEFELAASALGYAASRVYRVVVAIFVTTNAQSTHWSLLANEDTCVLIRTLPPLATHINVGRKPIAYSDGDPYPPMRHASHMPKRCNLVFADLMTRATP
jgi:hypothetical protein